MSGIAHRNWLLVRAGKFCRPAAKRGWRASALSLRARLAFEPLEERRLLAITVDALDDLVDGNISAGHYSLREAIGNAGAGETINFSVTGQINLSALGQLTIDKNLTIAGPGANLLTIKAFDPTAALGDGARIFLINNGNDTTLLDVAISGLTLTGGDTNLNRGGGAIFSRENLEVADCIVTGNRATPAPMISSGVGGGITNVLGDLVVTNCTISNNTADEGGGLYVLNGDLTVVDSTISGNKAIATDGYGGGIYSGQSDVSITGSTISKNTAGQTGGGLSNRSGNVSIMGCTISDNSSGFYGGGVIASGSSYGLLTVTNTVITGNESKAGGGLYSGNHGATVTGCTITDNKGESGGGILAAEGSLTVSRSTISGNIVTMRGGGIEAYAAITVIDATTITRNTADTGGGIWHGLGDLILSNSTLSGNMAAKGGGVYSRTNFTTQNTAITNSTISGNTASGLGGGVYNLAGRTEIRYSTITNNGAPANKGGGVASNVTSTATVVTSSIIAGNPTGNDVQFVNGVVDSFISLGYNLIGTGNAAADFTAMGDHTGVLPLIGLLADNGGPTMTHALLVGSAAIDAGRPGAAAGVGDVPLLDQRGATLTRVFDGDGAGGARIDIGAYEFQPIPPALFGDYNHNHVVDAADYTVWRNGLGQTGLVAYSGADGTGDGKITRDDFDVWKQHYGQTVPVMGSEVGAGSGEEESRAGELRIGFGELSRAADFGLRIGEVSPHIAESMLSARQKTLTSPRRVTSDPALFRHCRSTTRGEREKESRDAALLAWFETRDIERWRVESDANQTAADGRLDETSADGDDNAFDAALGSILPLI